MRNVNLESDRGHNLIRRSLQALDISVGKAGDSVARVVSRESLSQPDLHVATRISSEIIINKNLGTRSDVPARVERARNGQPNTRQVGAVDLHQTEIDGIAGRSQHRSDGNRLS
jgi:hypothetical protein